MFRIDNALAERIERSNREPQILEALGFLERCDTILSNEENSFSLEYDKWGTFIPFISILTEILEYNDWDWIFYPIKSIDESYYYPPEKQQMVLYHSRGYLVKNGQKYFDN